MIEAVVALAVATVMFTALAYTAASAVQTSQVARQNQQAIDLANATVEQMRETPWGSLGHDPAGIQCSDTALSGCPSDATYQGEELVQVAGGLGSTVNGGAASHITQVTENNVTYQVKTYVTRPDDDTGDYRRLSVVVEWSDYGRPRSKTASTVISQSTRGLPLPDFTLTPIGSVDVTVNPGATAVWGFELTNQGAPDTWNITSNGDFDVEFYLDDGNDQFSPSADNVQLQDSTGDAAPDTGRLDPQHSFTFWAVYEVPAETDDQYRGATDVVATSASQASAATASKSVTDSLLVTTGVITASPTPTPSVSSTPSASVSPSASSSATSCPDTSPAPTPAAVSGYSRFAYVMHNSGNTAWPVLPLPGTDPVPGSVALKPMALNLTPDQIPSGRELPVLSTDLSPANTPGRILYSGGSFSSEKQYVADFLTSSKSKKYASSVVVRTWVDQVPGSTSEMSLSAQLYQYRSSGNKVESLLTPVTRSVTDCNGLREVSFAFTISTPLQLTSNYVLGVRIWNSGSGAVRLGYDHADYSSTVTVVEQ